MHTTECNAGRTGRIHIWTHIPFMPAVPRTARIDWILQNSSQKVLVGQIFPLLQFHLKVLWGSGESGNQNVSQDGRTAVTMWNKLKWLSPTSPMQSSSQKKREASFHFDCSLLLHPCVLWYILLIRLSWSSERSLRSKQHAARGRRQWGKTCSFNTSCELF